MMGSVNHFTLNKLLFPEIIYGKLIIRGYNNRDMSILIDGHNLIPHLPGINLSDIDDEEQLINWLQSYCRLRRRKVTVFFDQAPAGFSGERDYGAVKAYFVRQGGTADDAIAAYLKGLGKVARNYKVVSSDRMVMAAARSVHAQAIPADVFAQEMVHVVEEVPEVDPHSPLLSAEELEDWEELFKERKKPDSL